MSKPSSPNGCSRFYPYIDSFLPAAKREILTFFILTPYYFPPPSLLPPAERKDLHAFIPYVVSSFGAKKRSSRFYPDVKTFFTAEENILTRRRYTENAR